MQPFLQPASFQIRDEFVAERRNDVRTGVIPLIDDALALAFEVREMQFKRGGDRQRTGAGIARGRRAQELGLALGRKNNTVVPSAAAKSSAAAIAFSR